MSRYEVALVGLGVPQLDWSLGDSDKLTLEEAIARTEDFARRMHASPYYVFHLYLVHSTGGAQHLRRFTSEVKVNISDF